ncbi:hypothetical protein DL991_37030 [Amycolatopsis sp. WAC 01375]|uniref:hypothetical protein n=1 Tax=unclassified Amycolatopsis TaxID=2618356 RepID=UPI000F7803C3|nr:MULTISPECIES: hypothetical protein [unclassified Amycolatopsis]RSM71281.1 hypothetical protein DL991_37030 [Amycolatopsis sp. WAC 01375]RSN36063.1 hypothetical protein DL990_07915 [Amycolatopsis sp. WAC 01416]
MQRLAFLFILLGFGSVAMTYTDRQFVLLMWAEDYQPVLGIVVGVLGVALLVAGLVRNKKAAQAQPVAQQAPQEPAR